MQASLTVSAALALYAYATQPAFPQDITVADAGLTSFVAPGQEKATMITARLGEVGGSFVIDLYGDQIINFYIDEENIGSKPGNSPGFVDRGLVQVSAESAGNVLKHVVREMKDADTIIVHENGDISLK